MFNSPSESPKFCTLVLVQLAKSSQFDWSHSLFHGSIYWTSKEIAILVFPSAVYKFIAAIKALD